MADSKYSSRRYGVYKAVKDGRNGGRCKRQYEKEKKGIAEKSIHAVTFFFFMYQVVIDAAKKEIL